MARKYEISSQIARESEAAAAEEHRRREIMEAEILRMKEEFEILSKRESTLSKQQALAVDRLEA